MSKSYTPEPLVPPELMERMKVVLLVMTGAKTVSAGAEELGLSRNHFQTVIHRAMLGLIEGLRPGEAGRPAAPAKEKELQERLEKLEGENDRLRQRVETIDRLMGVASGILRGQVRTRSTRKKKSKAEPGNEPEDPDGEVRKRIEGAQQMRVLGLSAPLAAAIVGASASTLRRWKGRLCRGERAQQRRGPRQSPELTAEKARLVEDVLREVRGLCGAESLRHSVPGVSRRQAAAVKVRVLTELERERIAACTRLRVVQPGVMRNLDQLYVPAADNGVRTALIASDASVPYRTTARVVPAYTAEHVARTIEQDVREHGAPLVLRMDRASSHRAPLVSELLREHGVLVLHGPPRHPQYYGQHERQNRDHQAWLDGVPHDDDAELEEAMQRMLRALNGVWRRKALGWRTPSEAWLARTTADVDRRSLRDEVLERAQHLHEKLRDRSDAEELARRLAIEQALEDRGLVQRIPGGWC
jgi:transposase